MFKCSMVIGGGGACGDGGTYAWGGAGVLCGTLW